MLVLANNVCFMSGRGPLSLCSAVPLFGLPLSPQQMPGATSGAKKEQETIMNGLAGGFALGYCLGPGLLLMHRPIAFGTGSLFLP